MLPDKEHMRFLGQKKWFRYSTGFVFCGVRYKRVCKKSGAFWTTPARILIYVSIGRLLSIYLMVFLILPSP